MTMAHSASATTELVSDVGVFDWDTVYVPYNNKNEVATGIIFNNGQVVFCVDLEHVINVGHYDQPLVFTQGILTDDGAGNPISEADSNRIGQIAAIGQIFAKSGDADFIQDLEAVQAAIWSIEYHTLAVSGDPEINSEIAKLLNVVDNGHGYARALIAHGPHIDGTQNMVTGGVPEPTTWALMIAGFGMVGGALRRRRPVTVTA